ncbi:MAG: phenylpropionate dioxygenase-like ring-hydroxylating dioxygenase large terminal subunit [Gammaproteobacteria bacterium]|jgi:phenylpropionate dioxygenase-like ring-hydroxylating dioxygenase large terminal subunit
MSAGFDRIPIEPNISADYFAREKEAIFKKVWLKVGRVEEIDEPGSFMVRDFAVLSTSIIISRGNDGELRAFHNLCRHRGNRLKPVCEGRANAFTCGFHGWVYDANGKLTHIPLENDFGSLDKETLGLLPVALDTWQGFIFINLNPSPSESLETYLGQIPGLVEGYPFEQMARSGQWTADIESNWKTFQDAFVEAYHVQTVHRRSIPDYRATPVASDLETFGQHSNLTFYLDFQHTPQPAEAWAYKAGSMAFLNAGDAASEKKPLAPGLNRHAKSNWIFDEFLIFPNFHLFLGEGWMLCHDFWPVSVNQTDWSVSYFLQDVDSPILKIAQEYSKVTMRDTIREDLSTIESTHSAHRSGALEYMVVSSDLEGLVTHHHRVVDAYVNGDQAAFAANST